jgi:hypothetical protein
MAEVVVYRFSIVLRFLSGEKKVNAVAAFD